MGNCILKGFKMVNEMVKVVTPNGGVMELYPPITAECVTNEFPGYAIFLSSHRLSPPLLHTESLTAGHLYYLLPIHKSATDVVEGNYRGAAETPTPYRMSVDNLRKMQRKQSGDQAHVVPRCKGSAAGVSWKVRLVIGTDQLSEILSQETRTEELIESVRTAAKCAAGVPSAANSDRRSQTSATQN